MILRSKPMPKTSGELARDRARDWTVIDGGASGTKDRPVVIAALLRSSEVEMALRGALADDERKVLRVSPVQSVDLAALHGLQGDVIIFDLDAANRREPEVLGQFVADPTSPPLIVTSPSLDAAGVCELVHKGIHHVLLQPLKSAELNSVLQLALTRSEKRAVPARQNGMVVTFIGSCGGVGATSLAVQGACALSRLRRFRRAADLCLLDFDVQFGTAALLLDLEQRASIIDLVRTPKRLDGALLHGAMIRAAGGRFDLLGSPSSFLPVDDIDTDGITTAVEIASREYALTIIDMPTLWSNWTHAVLRASNAIILVAQPTVPSLRQGRRQIEMLRQEELDDIPLTTVINRVVSSLFGSTGVPMKAAETALGRKVDYVIPESPAMRAAADAGLPLSDVRGGGPLESKIAAMLEAIIGGHGEEVKRHSVPT